MTTENFPLTDFRERMNALSIDGRSLPQTWTPEHVVTRIIGALRTLREGPQAVGPGGSSTSWPPLLIAAAKARDTWLLSNVPQRVLENLEDPISHPIDGFDDRGNPLPRFARDLPTSYDLSLMQEAIAWPLTYLVDEPLQSDALMLYCLAKANKRFEIQPILRNRLKAATLKAWGVAAARENAEAARLEALGINPYAPGFFDHPASVRLPVLAAAARRKIARKVAIAYNRGFANFGIGESVAEARRAARDFFIAECNAAGAEPEGVDPIAASPHACLFRWQVDRHRRRAAYAIAAGLVRDGVSVR